MTATRLAYASMTALLALAFAGAWMLQDAGLLSRIPPATVDMPNPVADVAEGATFPLYLSAFTAWVALIFLIPAYATVWRSDAGAQQIWRAFWTVSWIAYIVHLLISMFWFFGGDFGWMTSSSRVSAFWPGMVIALWWPIDILLAGRNATWVIVQRVVLHMLVLILFVGGSAVKGELPTVQVIGWVLVVAAIVSTVVYGRKRQEHV